VVRLVARERFRVTKGGVEYEFEAAEEGGYIASVPAYAACVSQGETFEEALENVEDALRECLSAARELGLAIPEELNAVVA